MWSSVGNDPTTGNGVLQFPTVAVAFPPGIDSHSDFNTAASIYESNPTLASPPCDLPLTEMSGDLQQNSMGQQPPDAFRANAMELDMAFLDDYQYFPPLYQGPHVEYRDEPFLPSEHFDAVQVMLTSENALDQDLSGSSAPVPSFLGARSSPEPNDGQVLRFDDFVRRTWAIRRHVRDSDGNEPGVSARGSGAASVRLEKNHHPPLMGTISPTLSSDTNDSLWGREDLAHVRTLPQHTYDKIVAKFNDLNATSGHYTQFTTGSFPSLAACNAFLQLFFEHFNLLCPFIHQPSFDTSREPWLLLLAIISTGCRFSQVPAAGECADILQEFLRRAIQATIEEDYGSTCEPWLAQAGLLNQIGMQFSADLRLSESAQSMRSLIGSIARKVNCFNESERYTDSLEMQLSCAEAWSLWVRGESRRRLAYTLWLVDSQIALFFDLPPVIPTSLLRDRLPSSEKLWHAPTASVWRECWKENSTYQPLNIRSELNFLYKSKARRQGLGDFAILLLVMGVFRSALQYRRSLEEGFDPPPRSLANTPQHDPESGSAPETFAGTRKAMYYLHILCSEDEDTWVSSSLKGVVLHHYHSIGVLFRIPLGELFCFCGYRVTSAEIARCQDRLRFWVHQRGTEARQVAYHAGRLFGYIRQSNMYAYYECRAFMVVCQSLWVYGELASLESSPGEERGHAAGSPATPTVRLDQHLGGQLEQAWTNDGAGMRPILAGVGCILGPDGVSRLIQESSRILCASTAWGFAAVMGKALRIFHKLRSGTSL